VNTDLKEKVDISRILIHPVDGSDSKARVTSIEAANTVLSTWVRQCADAASAEYAVEILFEDGMRYRGHYKLRQKDKASLGRDIRRSLAKMTEEDGQPVKRGHHARGNPFVWTNCGPQALNAKAVLEHYNL
jgi:hypothetical protein